MSPENYSIETSIIEDGKTIKGTLFLFKDEYVFGNVRKKVNWENVICEKDTVNVRGFLRNVEKQCITFRDNSSRSPQFFLKENQINTVMNVLNSFIEIQKKAREEKAALNAKYQTPNTGNTKTDIEIKAHKILPKIETNPKANEIYKSRLAEKQARIKKEVNSILNQSVQEKVEISTIAKKAGIYFLNNPYRILGISCRSSNEEANTALDKLKKLARLKALESYRSSFDLFGVERPIRNLSVAQNALVQIKDKTNKWFWFADDDACIAWKSGKYRMELVKEGNEFGTYDLFLANYMYAILCDPNINTSETWKRIFNFYCYICTQNSGELLRSRFTEKELSDTENAELLNSFCSVIFKPILLLCERDDLDAILRLQKCIKDCNNKLLENLLRNVLGKLVSWFTDKEAEIMKYLAGIDLEDTVSVSQSIEIRERGDAYCKVVEPVFEMVLRDFSGDSVRYEMIKESYRKVTYQLMYILHKCSDKSNAVYFANKCYSYCKPDDKKRIKNTFGEVNIKVIDWGIPHTGWDIKGDEFYYGRGCTVDYTQALYWYHKAADAGNMYSQNSIGLCYQRGNGVPKDEAQAIMWFKKAFNSGNPEGAYNLAECFYSGTGVKKDVDQALKYWTEAAKLGHPSAQQKRDSIFAEIQAKRIRHRANNHICHDIGFQMTTGPNIAVEVTLNQAAYVYLVNIQGYQNYLNGNEFSHYGGYASTSPYNIRIPSSNHWYVIIDNGDDVISSIVSSVKVKRI